MKKHTTLKSKNQSARARASSSAGPDGTPADWERAGTVAVLPIGAQEQHGPHLPLDTDSRMVGYFAAHLARALRAALLPVLPIGQSYEQSGARGTLSFRPETVLAMLRDLADELERQGFTRLVICNGHGGNYALGTLTRDLNRMNRPLRVVLAHWYEHDRSPEGAALAQGEIHAGAWETAIMLHLFPQCVRRPLPGPSRVRWPTALVSDLNHLGVRALRPGGYWGDPRRASAAAGRAIVDSVLLRLAPFVRERLAWLDRVPRYAGAADPRPHSG